MFILKPASPWWSMIRPERSSMSVEQVLDTEVYVRLLDEGVDVWRPVRATKLSNGSFRLGRPDEYDPQTEAWEFPPNAIVRCKMKIFSDGNRGLVAVAEAA
jgi:hypothetical protein